MGKRNYRVAVVGASSLLGKEIGEELADGGMGTVDVVLLDSEEATGKLEQMGDEAAFLQAVEPSSFEGVDVAIFATGKMAEMHVETARSLGCAIVDASGWLSGVPVRAPQVREGETAKTLDLETGAVAAAHPVTTMLTAVLKRISNKAAILSSYATVLQPASANGAAALDELHQQTVNVLSFQPLPEEEHDTQTAFNLLPRFGEDAKAELGTTSERVRAQLKLLLGNEVAPPAMQWLQAPVFHGFAVSLFVVLDHEVEMFDLREAVDGDLVELVVETEDPVSNLSAAGQGHVLLELRPEPAGTSQSDTFVVWMMVDNLKLLAQTAVGCALELTRLRPLGKVQ